MAVSLVKGGNVSLTKEAPTMNIAVVGLGWDARVTDGSEFDLDASVFMVGENGKVLSDQHFIFFNNKVSPCGSVVHQGDNRTGAGDGDDEQIKIDLKKVPADVKKIIFSVTIYDAEARKQTLVWSATASCVWSTKITAQKLLALTYPRMPVLKPP